MATFHVYLCSLQAGAGQSCCLAATWTCLPKGVPCLTNGTPCLLVLSPTMSSAGGNRVLLSGNDADKSDKADPV